MGASSNRDAAAPLRRALEAEREARRDVERAEEEARALLADARARARAIQRQAQERIARVSRAGRTRTQRLLEELEAEERAALERLEGARDDTEALEAAAGAVAEMLTRGSADEPAAGERQTGDD